MHIASRYNDRAIPASTRVFAKGENKHQRGLMEIRSFGSQTRVLFEFGVGHEQVDWAPL